jgi:hypothetical protein
LTLGPGEPSGTVALVEVPAPLRQE